MKHRSLRPKRCKPASSHYLCYAAVVGRSLLNAYINIPALFPQYLGAALVFLVCFVLVMWRPTLPNGFLHLYFLFQSIIVAYLLFLPPHLDFINVLFILLSYQAALVIAGRGRWIWCGIFIALTAGILIYFRGVLPGIAFATTPIAGCIIFPVYVIANREQERARIQGQKILGELQRKHEQLVLHTAQVEQIAAIEERNRLARELHDSVSQTMFSIILNTRATQILLERTTRIRLSSFSCNAGTGCAGGDAQHHCNYGLIRLRSSIPGIREAEST
jgi:signal transduction histidine kinase